MQSPLSSRNSPMRNSGPIFVTLMAATLVAQDALPVVPVEGQPLAANARRVVQALAHVGQDLTAETAQAIEAAAQARDHAKLQTLLDRHALLVVAINPESRVKVLRGPAPAT